jgi:hypothetical protein
MARRIELRPVAVAALRFRIEAPPEEPARSSREPPKGNPLERKKCGAKTATASSAGYFRPVRQGSGWEPQDFVKDELSDSRGYRLSGQPQVG